MNWKELWMYLFGTTEWLGCNLGFWVGMAAVLLIVVIMNAVVWSMKPAGKDRRPGEGCRRSADGGGNDCDHRSPNKKRRA